MASDWLNHKMLMLQKGIGITQGDSNTAEPMLVNFNMMTDGVVTLEDWSPQIPPLKNGGVWSDSPIVDGRTLLAAPAGNITEKITLLISDRTYLEVARQVTTLTKLVSDCRDFWQSQYQIDPVYLTWWAGCGVAPQYALLYNIDIGAAYVPAIQPTMRLTISLEREPYWRGIPPGANPKLWAYYVNSAKPQMSPSVSSLVTLSDHLITQIIQNKFEWTPAAFGAHSTPISKNYIEITADQVPGDAPALVELSYSKDAAAGTGIAIGRTSKPLSRRGHDGATHHAALNLNVGDFASGAATKTAVTSAFGVRSNNSAATFYQGVRSTAGVDGAYVGFALWGTNVANTILLDRQLYRGSYAVFCRCYATNLGADTDHKIRVTIEEYEYQASSSLAAIVLPETFVTQAPGPVWHYMGTVTLPLETRAVASMLGYGQQIQETTSNLRVTLEHRCMVAGARTMNATDLMFMPMDEGLTHMVNSQGSGFDAANAIVYDTTGYLNRGAPGGIANGFTTAAISGGVGYDVRGDALTLLPRTNQRLYFCPIDDIGSTSSPVVNFTIRMNIVPRWSGIRDA